MTVVIVWKTERCKSSIPWFYNTYHRFCIVLCPRPLGHSFSFPPLNGGNEGNSPHSFEIHSHSPHSVPPIRLGGFPTKYAWKTIDFPLIIVWKPQNFPPAAGSNKGAFCIVYERERNHFWIQFPSIPPIRLRLAPIPPIRFPLFPKGSRKLWLLEALSEQANSKVQ